MNSKVTQPKLSEIFESSYEVLFDGPILMSELSDRISSDQEFILKPTPEFITSVREFGVIQPIQVEQINDSEINPKYFIRAGKRRYQAAKICELEYIRIVLIKTTGLTGAAITLAENLHRSQNPIAEFEAICEIDDEENHIHITDEEIARALSIPVQTVKKRRKITQLPSPVIEALRNGKIAITTAEHIAKKAEKSPQILDQIIDLVHTKDKNGQPQKVTRKMIDDLFTVGQHTAMQEFELAMEMNEKEKCAPDIEMIDNLIDFYMPDIKGHAPNYHRGARKMVMHILKKGLIYEGTEQ